MHKGQFRYQYRAPNGVTSEQCEAGKPRKRLQVALEWAVVCLSAPVCPDHCRFRSRSVGVSQPAPEPRFRGRRCL